MRTGTTRIGTKTKTEDEDEEEEEEEKKSKADLGRVCGEPSCLMPLPGRPARIWTIGHSNHPLETFLDLLARHQIEVVVDVRSSPYSRYASQFNREAIRPALRQRAIQYLFLGDLLGGRAEDERFYDDEGRVLYGRLAQSPGFRQGIERLLERRGKSRVAILCGEEDPTDCHRRPLVGRVLQEHGVRVMQRSPLEQPQIRIPSHGFHSGPRIEDAQYQPIFGCAKVAPTKNEGRSAVRQSSFRNFSLTLFEPLHAELHLCQSASSIASHFQSSMVMRCLPLQRLSSHLKQYRNLYGTLRGGSLVRFRCSQRRACLRAWRNDGFQSGYHLLFRSWTTRGLKTPRDVRSRDWRSESSSKEAAFLASANFARFDQSPRFGGIGSGNVTNVLQSGR